MKCTDLRTWNARIADRLRHGRPLEALQIYPLLLRAGIRPNPRTFICLLKACAAIPDPARGAELHGDARRRGLLPHLFLCNTVISMYGKCGATMEAEDAFRAMPDRSTVTWNVLMAAYAERSCGEKVLRLFRQMLQEEEEAPDQYTIALAVRACAAASLQSDRKEEKLRASMGPKAGVGSKGSAAAPDRSKIEEQRSKIGEQRSKIEEPRSKIEEQRSKIEEPRSKIGEQRSKIGERRSKIGEPLSKIEEQRSASMHPEASFGSNGGGDALDPNPNPNPNLNRSRIASTPPEASSGSNDDSVDSNRSRIASMRRGTGFGSNDDAPDPDPDPNRSRIASVRRESGCGSSDGTLDLNPNRSTVTSVRRESRFGSNDGTLDPDDPNRNKTSYLGIGRALHSYAVKRGLACSGVLLKNALVSMYGRWGRVAEAENVVYSSSEARRDVVSWSAIISIYVGCGEAEKALLAYMQMHSEGVDPDRVSCVLALQACACLADREMAAAFAEEGEALEIGRALQADIEKKGYASDARVATALIGMHGRCGAIPDAERVFDEAFHRDLVAWNAMLSAYAEGSRGEKALVLYREMREAGVGIDEVTLLCSLRACEGTGSPGACRELHFVAAASGWEKLISVAAALIHTYASCAGIPEADMLHDTLAERDLVSWTALLASHGARSDDSGVFEESRLQGIVPDEVMFTSLLAAFSHTGLVARALGCFESMAREYGITPQLKQYGVVIDLLGRAGDLRRAESLLRNMPVRPDLAILGFLLGACATHGDVELAKQAFDFALMLEPRRANAYVFMSNVAALHDCAE